MSEQLTFTIDDFRMKSSWTNKDGAIVSGPSKTKLTKNIDVSGIPEGGRIDAVTLNVSCGGGYGGPRILTVNDERLINASANAIDFSAYVTGNGSYAFEFIYQDYGASLADGSHYGTIGFSNISLVIDYTGDPPSEDPDNPPDNYDYPDSHNISFYAPDDDDFTTNGLGILTPTSCIITEEAGGQYELEMTLPADGEEWKKLQCECVIKAPVPVVTIEDFQMVGASYWKVKGDQSNVPIKSKVPTITRVASTSGYSEWSEDSKYVRGSKVKVGNTVYQYTGANQWVANGIIIGQYTKEPGTADGKYWENVTTYSTKVNSGKTLGTLARNEIFTMIEEVSTNSNWIRIKTSNGVTGYIEKKYADFYSDIDTYVRKREIRQQCFRVYRIERDSSTRMITISARHISYDFAKTYLSKCEMPGVTAPTAIALIQTAMLVEDNRHIYTDISSKTVDLDCSWDNGVTALLNPDTGIVSQLQAKLIRDNEDFFVLNDNHTDRGFRIEYGNNLKALQWSMDTSSMATRIIPHCKDKDDADLMLPEQWVDSELIDDYPVVYIETLSVNCKEDSKGTVDGEEVEKLTKEQCYQIMREEAQKRFDVDHADEPEIEIEVDLVMLGATEEFKHLAPVEILFMYDTVHIRHPLLGIDMTAYMTGYEYDAILRRYQKITLSNDRRRLDNSVSGYDIRNNSIRFEKLSSTAIDRLRA